MRCRIPVAISEVKRGPDTLSDFHAIHQEKFDALHAGMGALRADRGKAINSLNILEA